MQLLNTCVEVIMKTVPKHFLHIMYTVTSQLTYHYNAIVRAQLCACANGRVVRPTSGRRCEKYDYISQNHVLIKIREILNFEKSI